MAKRRKKMLATIFIFICIVVIIVAVVINKTPDSKEIPDKAVKVSQTCYCTNLGYSIKLPENFTGITRNNEAIFYNNSRDRDDLIIVFGGTQSLLDIYSDDNSLKSLPEKLSVKMQMPLTSVFRFSNINGLVFNKFKEVNTRKFKVMKSQGKIDLHRMLGKEESSKYNYIIYCGYLGDTEYPESCKPYYVEVFSLASKGDKTNYENVAKTIINTIEAKN